MTPRRGELLGEPRQTFLKGHLMPVVPGKVHMKRSLAAAFFLAGRRVEGGMGRAA